MASKQFLMLILPILIMLLFVIALFLFTGLWRRTALGRKFFPSRRRSPLTDNLLRGPGQTLQDQLLDKMVDFAFNTCSVVILIFLVGTLVTVLRGSWSFTMLLWLALVACLILILYGLRNQSKKIQNLKLGLDGEMATAEELNQLMHDGYYVFHDFPGDKFNIDHIVIGPAGVFAVETKARSKVGKEKQGATVFFEGTQLKFPDYQESESIQQARKQAQWLSDFLRKSVGKAIPVKPVLALPGWMVKSRTRDTSILVINPKQAMPIITSNAKKLNEQTIQQIKYQVEQRCRTVKPYEPL